jgi:hypothetical protein
MAGARRPWRAASLFRLGALTRAPLPRPPAWSGAARPLPAAPPCVLLAQRGRRRRRWGSGRARARTLLPLQGLGAQTGSLRGPMQPPSHAKPFLWVGSFGRFTEACSGLGPVAGPGFGRCARTWAGTSMGAGGREGARPRGRAQCGAGKGFACREGNAQEGPSGRGRRGGAAERGALRGVCVRGGEGRWEGAAPVARGRAAGVAAAVGTGTAVSFLWEKRGRAPGGARRGALLPPAREAARRPRKEGARGGARSGRLGGTAAAAGLAALRRHQACVAAALDGHQLVVGALVGRGFGGVGGGSCWG